MRGALEVPCVSTRDTVVDAHAYANRLLEDTMLFVPM